MTTLVNVEPLVLSVKGAVTASGLSRSELYRQMKAGVLPYTTVGKRRLIPVEAIRRLVLPAVGE